MKRKLTIERAIRKLENEIKDILINKSNAEIKISKSYRKELRRTYITQGAINLRIKTGFR